MLVETIAITDYDKYYTPIISEGLFYCVYKYNATSFALT